MKLGTKVLHRNRGLNGGCTVDGIKKITHSVGVVTAVIDPGVSIFDSADWSPCVVKVKFESGEEWVVCASILEEI